ncbi:MAG: AbrB/MazE/SpoVT family DNA-binding domain-containing protein [Methylococcaceae bacterium]|nr:AbrB/MazE/SpoVT family DNA-binding domain-containing protein [Methylococcaceae bacterium]
MTQVVIRQSGGANIISLPKVILNTLDLHVGSNLELSLKDNKIVLSPIKTEPTLEEILMGSPKEALALAEEDKQWLNAPAMGKEI